MLSRKQIEKLGRRYRKYEETPNDRRLLSEYRNTRSRELPAILGELQKALKGTPTVMSARAKRLDTITRKLRREKTLQLPNMADIVGVRILAPSVEDQYRIAETLCASNDSYLPVKDYIRQPQASGYRGLHLIGKRAEIGDRGVTAFTHEVQIRTPFQHLWATYSESFGEKVKEGAGPPQARRFLAELSRRVAAYEKTSPEQPQAELIAPQAEEAFTLLVFDKKGGAPSKVSRTDDTEALDRFTRS